MLMLRRSGGTTAPGAETIAPLTRIAPASGIEKPRDHPQRRGLPAPGRPEQAHELAVLDGEADRVDRDDAGIALGQIFEREGGHVGTGTKIPAILHGRPPAAVVGDKHRTVAPGAVGCSDAVGLFILRSVQGIT